MGWGMDDGILWWFAGAADHHAHLAGHPTLDWRTARGSALFGSLVGHIVYGLIVGLIYVSCRGLARVGLFHPVRSDQP